MLALGPALLLPTSSSTITEFLVHDFAQANSALEHDMLQNHLNCAKKEA